MTLSFRPFLLCGKPEFELVPLYVASVILETGSRGLQIYHITVPVHS